MANFGILFLCLTAGLLLRSSGRLGAEAGRAPSAFIIWLAWPAIILRHVPQLGFDDELLFAAAAPWVQLVGAMGFFALLGKWLGYSRETIGTLVLMAGLGNTAFVGYPMVQALHGKEALGVAVMADQLG